MARPSPRLLAAHPLMVDELDVYHRYWCAEVNEHDSQTGQHVVEGGPLPANRELRACPACRPEVRADG